MRAGACRDGAPSAGKPRAPWARRLAPFADELSRRVRGQAPHPAAGEAGVPMGEQQPPNFIVFLTDDHGHWAMGCAGNRDVRTPTLDHLARTGIRFTHAFAPSSVCSSARASLMTGLMPSQHGIHDWLREDEPAVGERDWLAGQATLAQQLAAAGYRCMHVGKWHLGRSARPATGFSDWFGVPQPQGGHSGSQRYSDGGAPIERAGFKTTALTDEAVRLLRAHGPAGPFLLFVGYIGTHAPQQQPERLAESYREAALSPTWDEGSPLRGAVPPRERMSQYYAAVTHMDEGAGRILDTVEELGLRGRTAIVYTSDHGTALGQRGIWGKGNATKPKNLFDHSIRVPLIWSYPDRFDGGRTISAFVTHCDLYRTLLDIACVRTGAADDRVAGRSYLPLLEGAPAAGEDVYFGEYGPARCIRTRTHKLVRRYGRGTDELYDLVGDPEERRNLLEDGDSAVATQLGARLEAFFRHHEDPERSGLLFDPDSRGLGPEHLRTGSGAAPVGW